MGSLHPWLAAAALASVRIGVALLALQPFAMLRPPRMASALLALTLGACLASASTPAGLASAASAMLALPSMAVAVMREVLIGVSIAFGLVVAFAGFAVGGRLLDYQVGFGLAEIVDPGTRARVPLFGFLLQLLGGAMFFSLEGHHAVLRALAVSWEATPPGAAALPAQAMQMVGSFSGAFAYGLAVVAPVVVVLALLDAGVAVLSRALPQMNVLQMSLGLKALAAVAALAVSMRYAGSALMHVLQQSAPVVG